MERKEVKAGRGRKEDGLREEKETTRMKGERGQERMERKRERERGREKTREDGMKKRNMNKVNL